MVAKIVGALFVVGSAWLYGYYKAEYIKKRIEALEVFKRGFILYEKESSYSREPLDNVLREVGKRINSPAKDVFLYSAKILESRSLGGASLVWEEALISILCDSFLTDEDTESLSVFGKSLGFSSQGCQEANVYLTVSYIDTKITELKKKYTDEAGLYKRISIMTGILLAIAII